jgi:hypothetical protein
MLQRLFTAETAESAAKDLSFLILGGLGFSAVGFFGFSEMC